MEPSRPDPDLLLATLQRSDATTAHRRLRIDFGASAGLGKTLALRSAAWPLRDQGVDVAAGIARTQGGAGVAGASARLGPSARATAGETRARPRQHRPRGQGAA